MNDERAKRKLSAILSADVKGYSRLMGEDELSTIETLKKYRKLISSLIDQYRGRVVDSPGDNLLAEFGSAVDAVECAVKIQEEIKRENKKLPENQRMEFRIGVNLGDVVEDDERIYGDGVNIAARIEGLADAGGICISRSAYDQVKNKLSIGYEYLGEHSVKNIKDPIGVYRLLVDPESKGSVVYKYRRDDPRHRRRAAIIALIILVVAIALFFLWNFYLRRPSVEPASEERMAFPLPDKPSIAVLPFTNMSGDPTQDYIGDGLSENIIDALSVSSKLFVIDRTSTFGYKGKPVKVQQVAEDMGVHYVLEGSIQKSHDRVRVTAQLIDALTGRHLWSEKYDRQMKELFDLQDEITKKIVVSLHVKLTTGEDAKMSAKSTNNLEAWKKSIQGNDLLLKMNKGANIRAKEHFNAALELDPKYAAAYCSLARCYQYESRFGWSDSPSDSSKRSLEIAQKAVEVDEQFAPAHALLGSMYLYRREHEKAFSEGKKAITLNPNYSGGYANLGHTMFYLGRFEESIELLKKAFRLNPKLPPHFKFALEKSYIFLGHYEEALEVIKQMEEEAQKGRLPAWMPLFDYAWVYQEMGEEAKAKAYMAKALKMNPSLSVEWFILNDPHKNPAHLKREMDARRKAGLPEKAPMAVR